jgi:uncharacterized protein (TIGR00290 family)
VSGSRRRAGEDPSAPAVLAWSGGKDAAYALHRVRQQGKFGVVALLTTVESRSGRVVSHRVRGDLLRQQVESVGIPLTRVALPRSPSNAEYERGMASALLPFRNRGVRHVIFGDIFLEDIRKYRERQMAELGMECVFPLWGEDTGRLARAMIRSGFDATLVTVDTRRLPASSAGRRFDTALLDELPAGVDPCGENGEFHTFVTAGPVLARSVPVRVGPVRMQSGFATADLSRAAALPVTGSGPAQSISRGACPSRWEGA